MKTVQFLFLLFCTMLKLKGYNHHHKKNKCFKKIMQLSVFTILICSGLNVVLSAIVKYNLVYNRDVRSLDGYNKSVILVNGKFPAPPLRARAGDTISVVVTNFLMEMEALSVHWHGIDQRGTPWFGIFLNSLIL